MCNYTYFKTWQKFQQKYHENISYFKCLSVHYVVYFEHLKDNSKLLDYI